MYGVGGERRLDEYEVPWLAGLRGLQAGADRQRRPRASSSSTSTARCSTPCYHARLAGLKPAAAGWALEQALVRFVEEAWDEPDEGIWEVRGPRRHFTHSKVMAWVALDRAVKSAEQFGLEAPLDRWQAVRDAIHDRVCRDGFDPKLELVRPVVRLATCSTPAC